MATVALCVIATGKYTDFLPGLFDSTDTYFLPGHDVTYHVFTDSLHGVDGKGIVERPIVYHYAKHQPWPLVTLFRYETMKAANIKADYMYYIDVDMRFEAVVGDEIFGEYVAVSHPGYHCGGGAWEDRPTSIAYVAPAQRKHYVAGGFQGGSDYGRLIGLMANDIRYDYQKGIIPIWHDESIWNCFVAHNPGRVKILDPGYCMVEEKVKRRQWGIEHFKPKIIALKKKHDDYQT